MSTVSEPSGGSVLVWGWKYLTGLMAVSVALGVLFVALPAVVAAVAAELQFTPSQAGWVGSASLWGLVGGAFLAVPLSQRLPVRPTALVLTLASGAFEAACAFVTSPAGLMVLQALVGIAAGCALGMVTATVARSKNPDVAVSCIMAAQLAIGALVVVVLPPVLEAGGIGAGWYFIGGVMGAMFLIALATLPALARPQATSELVAASRGWSSTFLSVPVVVGLVSVFVFYVGQTTILTYYAVLGIQNSAMSFGAVNLALGIATLCGIAGALLGGWIGDRFGRVLPVCIMMGGLVVSMVLLYGSPSATRFWISVILFYFTLSYALVPWLAFMAGLDPLGRVMVVANFLLNIGFAVGASIAARIVAGSTDSSGFVDFASLITWTIVFYAASCALFVIAVLVAGRMRSAKEQLSGAVASGTNAQ